MSVWLIIAAVVVLAAVVMLAVRARQSLAKPVDGPPFSDAARAVMGAAQNEARARGHNQVGPEHLLLALCGDDVVQSVSLFASKSLDIESLRDSAERIMPPGGTPSIDAIDLPYTARAHQALRLAVIRAGEQRREETGPGDVVAGLLAEGRNSAARVLREAEVAT